MPIPTVVVSKHDMYHELAPVLLAAAEEIGRARIEPVE